jgi:hypothetical protein
MIPPPASHPSSTLRDVLEPALEALVQATATIPAKSTMLWPPDTARSLGSLLMAAKSLYATVPPSESGDGVSAV